VRPCPRLLAIAAPCIALASPVHAGRPLQTDDAAVLERSTCELEGFASHLWDAGADERPTSLQLGCGVGGATQLALALRRGRSDGERSSGTELNGKTRLWQGADEAPTLTVAYTLSSLASPGPHAHRSGGALKLVLSQPLPAALTLHANAGHVRDARSGLSSTAWAVALEAAAIAGVAPMAEVFGDDRQPAWCNLGVRVGAVRERVYIDASYGRQLSSAATRWLTLGFKVVF